MATAVAFDGRGADRAKQTPARHDYTCSTPCNTCIEMTGEDVRILKARFDLRRALQQRRRIMAGMNHQRDPILHKLPVEVACSIFDLCLPQPPALSNFEQDDSWPSSSTPFQLVLGAVCAGWRQIVRSNPAFWDILSLDLTPDTPATHVSLLSDWLSRSGKLDLSIRLKIAPQDESEPSPTYGILLGAVVDAINGAIHRCTLLSLEIPIEYIPCIYAHNISLNESLRARLQGLVITNPDNCLPPRAPLPHVFFNLSRKWGLQVAPSKVSITRISPIGLSIDWDNVTHFSGARLDESQCQAIVARCAQLIECKFASPRTRFEGLSSTDLVVHSALRSLDVEADPPNWLKRVSCPELRELRYFAVGRPLGSGLVPFLSHLVPYANLETLAIGYVSLEDPDLMTCLEMLPFLKKLAVGGYPCGDTLRRLSERHPALEQRNITKVLLPNLRHLSFRGVRTVGWGVIGSLIPNPPDIHYRPLEHVGLIFLNFNWNNNPESHLDIVHPTTLQHILELREKGISFSIHDNHQRDLIELSKERHCTQNTVNE